MSLYKKFHRYLGGKISERSRAGLVVVCGVLAGLFLLAISAWPIGAVDRGTDGVSFISYGAGGKDGGAVIPACGGSSCSGAGYWECGGGENAGCTWVATGPTPGTTCYSNANACGQYNTGEYDCSGVCTISSTPPANPSWYGQACTATNACGQSSSGTYNCGGTCSASAPGNPAGYGSSCTATNACGQSNSGTINCSGQCSASAPSNPAGYGNVCTTSANSCGAVNYGTIGCSGVCSVFSPPPDSSCTPPNITLTGQASGGGGSSSDTVLVRSGTSCLITWNASPATSCSLNGSSVGVSGTYTTPALTKTTDYTLTCYNGSTVSVQKTIKCQIIPDFKEI